jgi:hypothetical protein
MKYFITAILFAALLSGVSFAADKAERKLERKLGSSLRLTFQDVAFHAIFTTRE